MPIPGPVIPPLKTIAVTRRITQRQFADYAGIRYSVVNEVFNGRKFPSPKFVKLACRFFTLSPEELFGSDGAQR